MRPGDCDAQPASGPSDMRNAERSLDQAPMATTGSARIRRLQLTNFRSYRTAALAVERDLVVLVGPNGAGKTNLIEAISFLAPGRGLRRATLDEICLNDGAGDGGNDGSTYGSTNANMSWAVAAAVEGALGLVTIGTGIEAMPSDEPFTREYRIDREPVGSAAAFADHLRVVWLIPAMDGLFSGPASERRRFLDRLVLAVDAEHGGRVNALERSLRSRNRLLEQPNPDPHWLDAVEHETAELAVAVAAGRAETVHRLARRLAADAAAPDPPFPFAEIALDGWIENALRTTPASDIEDRYRAALRAARPRDAAAGRTLDGVHLTDLMVRHGPKGIAAENASTGEQKALLIGLVLAHAGLVAEMSGYAPVLLLDEIIAHLDPARRAALYDELAKLGTQVWMTGADPAAFSDIEARAQVFVVRPGQVMPRT
jgi:DNA replication and repair protein RecF